MNTCTIRLIGAYIHIYIPSLLVHTYAHMYVCTYYRVPTYVGVHMYIRTYVACMYALSNLCVLSD